MIDRHDNLSGAVFSMLLVLTAFGRSISELTEAAACTGTQSSATGADELSVQAGKQSPQDSTLLHSRATIPQEVTA